MVQLLTDFKRLNYPIQTTRIKLYDIQIRPIYFVTCVLAICSRAVIWWINTQVRYVHTYNTCVDLIDMGDAFKLNDIIVLIIVSKEYFLGETNPRNWQEA